MFSSFRAVIHFNDISALDDLRMQSEEGIFLKNSSPKVRSNHEI